MAREVVPLMKKNGHGKIINVVGTTGFEPGPMYMTAGATNAALLNFTKALSIELERDNIQVNAVNPGATDTALGTEIIASLATLTGKTTEEARAAIAASFPSGRIARPEEIAAAVVFLASDAANFINGTSLNIDAGHTAGL